MWDFLLQTVNAVEGVDSRLQRIKEEAAVIEQHNEKLEKQEENVLKKESANSAADQEVCDVKIIMHGICKKTHTCLPTSASLPVQHYLLVFMWYTYTA